MFVKKYLYEYQGVKYTIVADNAALAEKTGISKDSIIKYGPIYIIITEGVKGAMPVDEYPCIFLPENIFSYGLTKDEVEQLILHELGHLCVPGAIDYELRNSSVEKEMRADSFTTKPEVMISALKKLKELVLQCTKEQFVSQAEIIKLKSQFDLRIAVLRKRARMH